MSRTKMLADILTGGRFLLGLYLIWLGLCRDAQTITAAALVLLFAWASDVLDGPLARRDPRGLHTWVGDRDLEADMTVAIGVWAYLSLTGFIHPWLAVGYMLLGGAALWYFGSVHLAWGLQALPYATMIWTTWRVAPPYGLMLVAWIGIVVIATWPRFPRRTVPEFLAGMRALRRRDNGQQM